MQGAPDTLSFQTSAVHEGYAPKATEVRYEKPVAQMQRSLNVLERAPKSIPGIENEQRGRTAKEMELSLASHRHGNCALWIRVRSEALARTSGTSIIA